MCNRTILLVACALALSPAGAVWSGEMLIDDHFDGQGVEAGDAESVNGGFTLTANSIASAATATESGSNAEVTTTGGANGNAGITSNTSFDPLSAAAMSEGLTVEWVVTSLSQTTSANGTTFTLQPDNVFFNTGPYVGVMFSGKADTTPDGVRFVGKNNTTGGPTHNLSGLYNYERSSYLDGFTVSFTIAEAGWRFQITGLNDPTGTPQFILEEGDWPAGFSLNDVVDNESFVSVHAQTPGSDLVAQYDRCRVWIGPPEPVLHAIVKQPQDGEMIDTTISTLEWRPGDLAASQEVYFGESFDDVNEGLVEPIVTTDASLTVGVAPPHATGLTPGQTYYWRVDGINDAEPGSPWKGEVWSFQVRPATAWSPSPANGVKFARPEQDLLWEPGIGTLFHTVYFGESFDEVNDAVAGGFMTADATYDPGPLAADTTYYWRVDEFAGTVPLKGDVWSFTTVPEVAVTDPNLTLWWTLDEAMGATAVDWSGHGYHGIVYGDAQWTDGYQGTALTFENDVYVEAADHPGITGTAPRTCCAWIKTTTANRSIMSWGQNVAGQKWRMRADATGGLRVEVNGGYHYGITNIADGRWHHVAVTFEDDGTPDALDTLLYVDGQLDATAASLDEPIDTAAGPVRIGESPWHNAPFLGQIDDARVYDKVLTAEEIQQVMRGNPLLAGDPQPGRGATVDIRDISVLSWSAGDTAASHDVYFGTDRDAVAAADKDAPEFQGNQAGASLSLAGLVEFGGGDYYWRIDEVEADGTVHAGSIWKFTVPAYLIVEDFESYSNDVGSRIFEVWIDGIGFTLPEPGHPGNGTGAAVGHDVWSVTSPHLDGTIMETANVHGGRLAMPLYYDNTASPFISEAERTWAVPENWAAEGVTDLTLYIRGDATNDATAMYVAVEDTAGRVAVVPHPDAAVTAVTGWTEWKIPLADLTDAGVSVNAVKKMAIGVGNRAAPTPDGAGVVFIDDIRVTAP